MARPSRLVSASLSRQGDDGAELRLPAALDDGWALPERRITPEDLKSLLLASALHLAVAAACLVAPQRLGIGGLDPESIGVDIVALSSVLQSRPDAEGREAAVRREVADNEGSEISAEPVQATPESKGDPARSEAAMPASHQAEIKPKPELAALPQSKPAEDASPSPDPAPQQQHTSETSPERLNVALNHRSASEVLATFRGASASRGREDKDEVRIALASARAGLRNEFQIELFKAIVSRPPRHIRGVKGEVVVEFNVLRSGAIGEVRITRSSGNRQLDDAVSAAVRAAQVKPPPSAIPDDMLVFSMPFTFQ